MARILAEYPGALDDTGGRGLLSWRPGFNLSGRLAGFRGLWLLAGLFRRFTFALFKRFPWPPFVERHTWTLLGNRHRRQGEGNNKKNWSKRARHHFPLIRANCATSPQFQQIEAYRLSGHGWDSLFGFGRSVTCC
ncbi:MAG: hypothetical protein ACXWKC_17930 [Xanthobacteraceae bacterium]